jgi:hypothetical protein
MKLGTQTGSLINHIMANASVKDIVLGETGATLLSWSDRHAATVIDIFTKGKFEYIVVQEDTVKRVDANGISESQTYEFTRNADGSTKTFRITDKGFESVYLDNDTNRWKKSSNGGLMIGRREHFYDYSF